MLGIYMVVFLFPSSLLSSGTRKHGATHRSWGNIYILEHLDADLGMVLLGFAGSCSLVSRRACKSYTGRSEQSA